MISTTVVRADPIPSGRRSATRDNANDITCSRPGGANARVVGTLTGGTSTTGSVTMASGGDTGQQA